MEIAIGYVITLEEFEKCFGKKIPEKTHKEQRFDPKTGKQVKDEVIIDCEEEIVYLICNKKFNDEYDAAAEIAAKARCFHHITEDSLSEIIFYLSNVREEKRLIINDYYSHQGPIKFDHLVSLKTKLDSLKKKLSAMGLKCGDAKLLIID